VIIAALRAQGRGYVIGIALLCSLLTVLGYFLSADTLEPWKAVTNRGLALLVIWTTAGIGLQRQTLIRQRQQLLEEREAALTRALARFIRICAWCKRVQDDHDEWHPLDVYVSSRTESTFSHGMCPQCHDRMRRIRPRGAPGPVEPQGR
jgi:hypothetical protein